ncbi:hypothetical protein CBL_11625 [Carabus blaptoides fortunei]
MEWWCCGSPKTGTYNIIMMDHSSRSMKMLHLAISKNYPEAGNSTNLITKCDDTLLNNEAIPIKNSVNGSLASAAHESNEGSEQVEQYFMNLTVPTSSSQPKVMLPDMLPVKYPEHESFESEARDSTKNSEHVECSSTISTVSSSPAKDGNLYTVSSNAECPTKLRLTKLNEKNYCVSPIHSNESDVDDSDADPNFNSSCDSSSSSVSSISDSAKELVEVEAELLTSLQYSIMLETLFRDF